MFDVVVGPCDVDAVRAAVVEVRGAAGAVFLAPQAAGCSLGVQDAGHALAGEDLEVGVGEHGGGVPLGGQDSAGEAGGGLDAVPVVSAAGPLT
ncbi:hypothetical protein [Streptomyces sp. NRRL F-2664]|uniref:hypothetical protein n=1 Tax=Streptomyces sp. NRRL F-2664 TaxID=1463842 RepID=UPI00131CCD99|nr:hypothetical protein [Streptomyces sp. NRRL F-2664]